MIHGHSRDAFQRGLAVDTARGVVGAVDQQGAWPHCRPHRRIQIIGARLKPVLGPRGHGAGRQPQRTEDTRICHIGRLHVKRAVALICGGVQRGEQGGLPTRHDLHIGPRGCHTRARLHPRRHCIAQRRDAGDAGIAGLPGLGCGMHRIKDHRIGADVMLADGQLDHIAPRRLHRAGAVKHAPSIIPIPQKMRDPV